jgi:GDP-L-fucose synthase
MQQPFKIYTLESNDQKVLKKVLESSVNIENIRASSEGVGNRSYELPTDMVKTLENCELEKTNIISNDSKLSQIWYTLNKPENKIEVEKMLEKHFKQLYPNITYPLEILWNVTMYTEGCFIEEHIDGRDADRMAGFLFYLNESYDSDNGGLLRVIDPNTNEITNIVPEFGQAICIDYINNEVSHEVTPVKQGKRLAICAFIHKRNHMGKSYKILVTGASGFIGSQLVKSLKERGYWNLRTTSFSRDLPNTIKDKESIEHFKGDLQDANFCKEVSEGVDVVFHCAANTSNALDTKQNPLLHVTPNVEMNVNLMEQSWRNGVKKFMFISSNTVYPDMKDAFCTEDINIHATPTFPIYGAVGNMKRYGELLCEYFSKQIHNPMQCVIIRPSNAFGPNDKFDFEKCHVTPANIRKVADGLNPIPVWGDGSEVRDLLHVEDMADGMIFLAEMVDKYSIYNVCYGEGFSVNEVLGWIKEADNNDNPVEYVNNKAPMIPVRLMSSKKINELGWKPKRDLKQALKETLEWYKEHKHLYNPNSKP